ncbi:hypothetical protein Prudu_843S001100 [Prunus dulcis]|uniref:SWIM-type domain-containing protein n=1 Tax=Prunus dulcis TaxID=3755 RepID=A0A5H2XMG0_PRUDU|nr:hypothetical protein Prudu_843S001100 [Prunus dulcis]
MHAPGVRLTSRRDPREVQLARTSSLRRTKETARAISLASAPPPKGDSAEFSAEVRRKLTKEKGKKDMNMENNCMEDGEGETSTGLNISEGESNKKSSQAMKVRGIKIKERVVGSSKRPKNALEKLTKKRRTRKTELQNSSSVDSMCVPTTKAVPAAPSEISQDMNMENNCMEDGEGETSTGLNISEGESNKKSSQAMKGKREIDKRVSNVKYHRAETRCGCLARMKISCHLNDKYRVIEFVSEHNHVTTSPSKTHLFRSHRKITLAQIAEVDMADSSGIAPKAALEFLSRQAGGRESLGFIPDDYKNYLHSKRTREMKLGDTGDITTTQRSESMNSCIKKYVSYKYDLLRFFQHFQRLVEDRRYEELKAEFKASQSSPTLSFPVEILKHAANVYTPKVFKVFQDELCKAYDCVLHFNDEMGTISKYEVIPYGKNWQHTVTFDSTNNITLCSCKKFEFAGILCAHALKVLSTRNVKSIPAQYILKRWTKNVKAMSAKINSSSSTNDPKVEIVRRYRELCRLHTQLATRAAGCGKAYEIVIRRLNQTFDEVDACLKEKSSQEMCEVISPVINSRSELNECINVDDDIIKVRGIKIKERVVGSSKRPKNALEKLTKKRRTRKTELQNSSSVDSMCVPTTKAVPAAPSEISQAQSPLEGEFGISFPSL